MNNGNVELAKVLLQNFINDEQISRKLPVESTSKIIRAHRITRAELKEARTQLGIKTVSEDGKYYWILPEK